MYGTENINISNITKTTLLVLLALIMSPVTISGILCRYIQVCFCNGIEMYDELIASVNLK